MSRKDPLPSRGVQQQDENLPRESRNAGDTEERRERHNPSIEDVGRNQEPERTSRGEE
jgi:hypothetical protein